MQKGDVGLVFGLAGFLLGGVAIFLATGARRDTSQMQEDVRNVMKSDDESLVAMGEKLKATDDSIQGLNKRVNGLSGDPRKMWEQIQQLQLRLDKLESGRSPGDADAPKAAAPAPKAGLTSEEFEELRKTVFSGKATPDEMAQFFESLREHPEVLADAMKQMEQKVAENPNDPMWRMSLARLYIAKLLGVPSGPEQGAWSMKAMEQYNKVLEQDPNHWDARYSLAMNWSQWPDFLNKRPDAIKQFETLMKIQEGQMAEGKHAQTYLQLRQLYLKDGRTEDAKAVLDRGLARFPDDEELKKARDGAK